MALNLFIKQHENVSVAARKCKLGCCCATAVVFLLLSESQNVDSLTSDKNQWVVFQNLVKHCSVNGTNF